MKKVKFLCIVTLLLFIISGCTSGSYTVINSSELNTPTKMSMSYEKFSGYKQTHIKVKNGETVQVKVHIVSESGSIDAYIAKDNGTKYYEGNDIKTSSFTVKLTEEGTYTVRVDAKKHSGSYSFSWE